MTRAKKKKKSVCGNKRQLSLTATITAAATYRDTHSRPPTSSHMSGVNPIRMMAVALLLLFLCSHQSLPPPLRLLTWTSVIPTLHTQTDTHHHQGAKRGRVREREGETSLGKRRLKKGSDSPSCGCTLCMCYRERRVLFLLLPCKLQLRWEESKGGNECSRERVDCQSDLRGRFERITTMWCTPSPPLNSLCRGCFSLPP